MSLDIAPFTDEQYWALCSANMGLPVPLPEADLTKPFVYDRQYGVFHVPMGYHQGAMSLLLAFSLGLTRGADAAERLGLAYSDATAEEWLRRTPGACFRSSVGRRVQAAHRGSLTVVERRHFGEVAYILEDRAG